MIDFPPPIPLNEVPTYVKLAKNGNLAARNQLITRNGRMVLSMAKNFARNCSYLQIDDLIQEGLLAIDKAIDMYDSTQGTTFPSYASFWIAHSFTRLTWQSKYRVHVPMNVIQSLRSVKKGQGKITAKMSDITYLDNLDECTDEFLDRDGKSKSYWDVIPDTRVQNESIDFSQYKLNKIDTFILDSVYNSDLSYQSVGTIYGVSRESIRQRALDALNHIKTIIHDSSPRFYLGMALNTPKLRNEDTGRGFNEYYVEIKGAIRRKLLKCVSPWRDKVCKWVDSDGNEYNIVYKIPASHFTRKKLCYEYNQIKKILTKADVKYEFSNELTSDRWYLKFDSYLVRYEIHNNKSCICVSSYLGDIATSYYEVDDISKLNQLIRIIVSKL